MIIPAKSTWEAPADGNWLNIHTANRSFRVSSKAERLSPTTVQAGFSYDVTNITMLTFHNDGEDDLIFEFEVSNLRAIMGSNEGVSVLNEPWIAGMRNPIDVNANATVDNGKMAMLATQNINELPNITIPANGIVQIVPARVATNRKVVIQIVTPDSTLDAGELSKLRLGASDSLAANEGIFLQGSENNSQGYELETETAVYARNMTGKEAIVTGVEQWR